jgi:hypothetical protein
LLVVIARLFRTPEQLLFQRVERDEHAVFQEGR